MELLLKFLRGSPPPRIGEADGFDLLGVAGEENLLPWITAQLSSMSEIPTAVAKSVYGIRREAGSTAFLWTSGLTYILAAFHHDGIPVVSLKGPWLAERLYGDTALRSCSDLDLLVHPRDIGAAEDLLSRRGFSPCGYLEDRHRPWEGGDLRIELHHLLENPLDFDMTSVWDRVQTAQFHGVPALLLAPPDELLFLCTHAVRHRFERMSLLLDLAHAFPQYPWPDVSLFGRRAREMTNVLVLAWMMTQRLMPSANMPRPPANWLERSGHLEPLADRLWNEMMLNPSRKSSWPTTHRLYVEIEAPGWPRLCRRARNVLVFSGRVAEPDFLFAERFHLRRRWQARMLRPVRLVLKRMFGIGKTGNV